MALNKQNIPITFTQGVDTKSDPKQLQLGKFTSLQNSVFNVNGQMTKRNGYRQLVNLPDTSSKFVSTFAGNLTAVGTSLQAYSSANNTWVNKGKIQPAELEVLPLVRSNTNQSQADSVVAANGLVCTVFTDNIPNSATTTAPAYKYVIADSVTGQNIVAPTVIPVSSGVVTGAPRVFLLGDYFLIVFTNVITAVNHLQFVAVSSASPTTVVGNTDISAQYTPNSRLSFDGVVVNNVLYLAWMGDAGTVKYNALTTSLVFLRTTQDTTATNATLMTATTGMVQSSNVIYFSWFDDVGKTFSTWGVDTMLNPITLASNISTALVSTTVISLTSIGPTTTGSNGRVDLYWQQSKTYAYDTNVRTDFIDTVSFLYTPSTQSIVTSSAPIVRSLGLASKAFIIDSSVYMLGVYTQSTTVTPTTGPTGASSFAATYSSDPVATQPTYFLIDSLGNIISKLAYSNGGVYYATGLPNISLNGNVAQTPYLIKDLVESSNKVTSTTQVPTASVYSQTGANLATFNVMSDSIVSSEIGSNLNVSGGIVWAYDGFAAVEQGFNVWPDFVETTTAGTGGFISTGTYFYQAVYEWSDNQGNVFRSAPSVPVERIIGSGTTNTISVSVPKLRLTYKTANPVKIVIYRWSALQQVYYQVTSIKVPVLNNSGADPDSITYVDTLHDTQIVGNNILYTTGGVVENIGPPATGLMTLYKSRLFLVDSEDPNLLWYSKQIIEATPVEMSDLFTIFVAPTTGAQGSTGPVTALSVMDDKLIIFKRDAIYYITGTGPDNTGGNNDFSEPTLIASTVGCTNPQSIVFMPSGLMFQSDKGIWLLGRDLSTNYIGAPVEAFNDDVVLSSTNIPGTNEVRFTLDTGTTLMYDYYYAQWGEFTDIPAISGTLYQNLQTYIDSFGRVFQENPGSYLDGARPVQMQFTTGWINLAGLQGFERAYEFYLLGIYQSPHKLSLSIAYDYNPSATQVNVISPDNYSAPYGGAPFYGSNNYGGPGNLEQWRIFLQQQKCQAFQITLQETFDPTPGALPGAGLTISGIDLTVGLKSGRPKLQASRQVG